MPEPDKIRVLAVDDSVVVRLVLSQVINQEPDLELVGVAASGEAALEKLPLLRPDVVVLDVEMPGIGGVETVSRIRANYPRLPVIMFSALTETGAAVTIEALTRGAADYVTKPSQTLGSAEAISAVRAGLLPKIRGLGRLRLGASVTSIKTTVSECLTIARAVGPRPAVALVCLAASTGGPEALSKVLEALPGDLPVPVLVVQHMPPYFTKQLAQRLATRCAMRVREAESGEALVPGEVLIAPGDYHLVVRNRGPRGCVVTNRDEPENSCRPAADVLLRSAAEAYGNQTLAVVLTGMGQDGFKGCQAVHAAGGRVVVQDEATSVVWGMPGAVARAGLASKELPIGQIAAEIQRRVWEGRP